MEKIKFYRKNVYGKELEYPASPLIANALMNLTGNITLTRTAKNGLLNLGFTFEEVFAPREEKNENR